MPPIMVSKSTGTGSKAPTKADLEVRAGRIVATDPRLKNQTERAAGVPKFLAQTLLKIIDAPRKAVFSTLIKPAFGVDVDSGYKLADKLGIGSDNIFGKVAGFTLDTALDPTTYLTAGTAGVGRSATKEAAAAALTKGAVKSGVLSEDIAKVALGRVAEGGGWAAAAKESPVVREIAEKVFGTEAAAQAGKRQTLSMANRQFTEAERAVIKEAGVKTGGVRFMGQTIVPAATTAKVTAPIAEKLAPNVAKVFSRVSPKVLSDVGVLGHTFTKGMREAEDARHLADEQLRGLANETAKVVDRKSPEQVQAFFDKIWRPGSPELWAGKLSPEAESAAEKWSASFAAMLDEAQAVGVPIQKLQNWNGPRVLTDEARKALYGTEKQGAMRVGSTPGFAKHRSIADFDEAQELMKDWLNLKPGEKFFSEDPFMALAQYGSVMNRTTHHSAAMKAFDEAGVRWGDLGKTGNNLKVQELKAAGFGKNGKKPVVEARRLFLEGAHTEDPRWAKLTKGTQDLVKAEAELTQTKTAKALLDTSSKAQGATRSLTGAQNTQEKSKRAAEYWLDQLNKGNNPEKAAKHIKQNLEKATKAETREAASNARLAIRKEAKQNLEAGLTASGKEWPGPNISRGEVPEGFQVVSNSGLGIFDQKAWPSHIAREIETNMKLGMPVLGKEWANFTGLFKKWVTIPFPGFHARNALGGYFNNFLGGVRNNHYIINEAIQQGTADEATPLIELGLRVADPNLTVGDAKRMMEQNRVWTRHSGGNQLADYMEGHVPASGRRGQPGWDITGLKQVSEGVERLGGRAVQEIEQRLRGASFLKGLEETGDAYGARMFTMMRHGDYEELTSFERNVMKQLIPFYKWMRMNVPYQLQSVIEQPGRVGMATDFWQNVVGDPGAQQQFEAGGGLIPPAVMAGGAAFLSPNNPISKLMGGGFNTVSADLPFYGVNNYFNANIAGGVPFPSLTGFAADLHPVIRTINEIVFKKRFYGGGEVGDIKEFSPVGGAYHLLGKGLEKLPGGDLLAVRTESGEIRMDSTLLSLLNVLPSSRVAALSRQLMDDAGPLKAGVGLGTGLRLSPLDVKSQTIEGYRRENILDQAVQELYSRGLDKEYKATAPERRK